METIVLLALSLLSCAVGFALEIVEGNIRHVRNGRPPDAGAAVIPAIPFVQLSYLAVAWGIDRLRPDLGFEIVAAYAVVSMMRRGVLHRRASARLKALIEGSANALAR